MSASFSIRDGLSPALRKKLARISDKRPILAAAGAALAGVATRAFRDPALRPAEWAPLAASTLRRKKAGGPLIDTGALYRSVIAAEPGRDSVEVGSDREYSLFHQFGTRRMPARPFFPADAGGNLTAPGRQAVLEAAGAAVRAALR